MKCSFILLTACVSLAFAAEASPQTARVNIRVDNRPARTVIDQIESQTDYLFVYNHENVDVSRHVSLHASNTPVAEVLAQVFGQSDVIYAMEGNNILLMKRSEPLEPQQNTRRITGSVIDEKGEPIIGANIVEKGTSNGTVTDVDGNFSLGIQANAVLQVSYIGYITQEISSLPGGGIPLTVRLLEDARALEEVVVVGYGVQRKVNLTGAVDQVTSEVFEHRPITNVSQGLVGAIPNLNIVMTDGKPTQSPSYNIRGTTSIGQGGSALVLIDGVEGDPRMLNPNDIESISVLKDAASASIYGARAAFGVVLITTKSAATGKTTVNYTANFSSKSPTTTPDNIVDSYPWAQGFSDAWSRWNDNGTTPTAVNKTMSFSPAYLAEIKRRWEDPSLPRLEINPTTGAYEYYYSTDWYKELYKDNFFAQDHNVTVTGGNEMASYYLAGRYNGEDGLYRYNTDKYSMYNLRAKGSIQLLPWLQAENNTEYSVMGYHQPINVGEGSNIWRNIADEGNPLAPMLNPDGSLSFPAAYTVGDRYLGKSYADLQQKVFKNKTAFKAEFLEKSLTLRADFTYQNTDYGHQRIRVQVPYSRYEGVTGYTGTNTNDLEERRNATEYMATNIYANYVKSFNRAHNFNLLVGYNYEQSVYKSVTMLRNGIVYEDARDINLALGNNIATTGGYRKWRIAGGFFRVNYNFKERYLLEVNGRYDGSSKFPDNQQWAFFPSVSAGWRLSEESFWHVDPKALSNVKIRASYGSLGNGSIDPYTFSENFEIKQSERILNGIRPQRTIQPNVIPSSLTWETATTGNAGLDISSLNNRLNLTGDVYRRWTKNMYTVGPSVPAIFGTDVPKGNYASLETTGWELSLGWMDRTQLAGKPFQYNVRFTMADSKSIVTDYYNPEYDLTNVNEKTNFYIGQTVGEIWGYQVEGLFRSEEEIASSPSQSNILAHNTRRNYVGDLKFKNLDGDDVIYQGLNRVGNSGDKTIIGNKEPRYVYSLSLGADWNGFFLSALFQGVGKQQWYPSSEARFWGQYNRPYNDYPRWQEDQQFRPELQNFDAYLPLLSGYNAQNGNGQLRLPNDRYLQNVAYIRLRTMNVGYTIPQSMTEKIKASNIRVYISGENLWTWSPLYNRTKDTDVTSIWGAGSQPTGIDSNDVRTDGDGYGYPMLKAITFGLSVTF
ncbi:MAG: TonB-dependent receptor [Tannerella sp.]|jgi:TonB-linked SusC/RagA family outer membrane protein|nr:TonB-dependent receptor [Tannerella sp.]